MRKALFTTAIALGVAIVSYAMMPPSARATTPNTCAMLANTPNSRMQIKAADQMIQRKIYAACLQTRGKQGASRTTAPGQARTNTTNAGAFVTFDVPGSTFTNSAAINNPGAVTGSYSGALGDVGFGIHSFLRTSDGTITPFDPPGTTCNPSTNNFCSSAAGINPAGTIVGGFSPPVSPPDFTPSHGFLRARNGTFTEFDPPGSQTAGISAINPAGTVTGGFSGSTGGNHGFL